MALLKEDGSLNVEWIDSLPYEEWMDVLNEMTQEQEAEYISSLRID